MLGPERRELIVAAVFERGNARTADLAAKLGVSEVTIRTDLEILERQGRVARVHGGATMPESPLVGFDQRNTEHVDAKRRIAAAAAQLISDDLTVILDSGTTAYQFACQLPTAANLVVLTPGINTALRLMDMPGVDVHLLGGRPIPRIVATVGTAREHGLEGVIAHIAFLGARGIDEDQDIVEKVPDVAESKRTLAAAARRRVLLADASKWYAHDRYKVMNVVAFDTVISDDSMPIDVQEAIRSAGPELILA